MALGGLDVLAFSGGVGENRDDVRAAIAERLALLGEFRVEVVPAREELVIADEVRACLELERRELNRALLARQMLLERVKRADPRVLERMGGLKARAVDVHRSLVAGGGPRA